MRDGRISAFFFLFLAALPLHAQPSGDGMAGQGYADTSFFIPLAPAIAAGAILYSFYVFFKRGSIFGYAPPPDFADRGIIRSRAQACSQILAQLEQKDESWSEKNLKSAAKLAFQRLFTSISNQDPNPLKKILREDLLREYEKIIVSHTELGIRRACEKLYVEQAEIVLVRAFKAQQMDEFTAWVRARASLYEEAQGEKPTAAEKSVRQIEHFLSFQREGDSWLLCRVERVSHAPHVLRTDNICEALGKSFEYSARGRPLISPAKAGKPEIAERAGRASKMLGRLVRTEAHWAQADIEWLARETYRKYYSCLSERDFSPMRHLMGAEFYKYASAMAREMKSAGIRIEARQLSVRDVEIVLVKNRTGSTKDEFTSYVCSHAQVVQLNEKGEEIGGDWGVRIFEEYLTFVHSDGWLLEEMAPPEHGSEFILQPDTDEEEAPSWTDWYYKMLPPDRLD